MKKVSKYLSENGMVSRRKFFKVGGAVIAGSTLSMSSDEGIITNQEDIEDKVKIRQFRTLGRTGFKVSDIAMGGTRNREFSVVRYAYDKGINYFDTGEHYVNGESERIIGDALKFMDRKKVFITTKLPLSEEDTEDTILERFRKCQERLQTEYVDALSMHGVNDVASLNNTSFHSAFKRLKAEGRVKFVGLSCHGPRRGSGDSMEKILCAAAEDGRFDLMLLVYNFMNKEAGDKVLAACKKNNVGTTAMKTSPGVIRVEPFDPENPTKQQTEFIERMIERGMSRETAIERMEQRARQQKDSMEKTQPFLEMYNLKTEDQLRKASIQWVLQNPDMHTVCISFSDFDLIDKVVPLSGTKLSQADMEFLREYKLVYNNQYCRHGCNECVVKCHHGLPVSNIMRYAYYFECQGQEKYAMTKYADLKGWDASLCKTCDAPCIEACPYGVDIQASLLQAHSLLTLA